MARLPVNKPYTITQKFGVADSNSKFGYHTGLDLAVPLYRLVLAPEAGVIQSISSQQYNGKVVQIKGKSGKYHRLMHNSSFKVVAGQSVKEGQEVATAGSTGLSTGVHCHWDVCTVKSPTSFSQFIDPNKWLAATNKPVVTYPKWVKVTGLKGAFVRSKPSTSAPLAGSRYLPFGTPFRVAGVVKGQSINGNARWYKTMYSNYVWSGNAK